MFNPDTLSDLVCPLGKKELKIDTSSAGENFLVCTYCNVKYPIKDGIPVLLIDEAILPEGAGSIDELKCMMK